jgi:probable HAF family extracellular repeat protein
MGTVVGSSTSSSGDRAFIWTRESGMIDLNSAASVPSGVVFVEAHAVNSGGDLLVSGKMSEHHADQTSQNDIVHPDDCSADPPASFLLIPSPAK